MVGRNPRVEETQLLFLFACAQAIPALVQVYHGLHPRIANGGNHCSVFQQFSS